LAIIHDGGVNITIKCNRRPNHIEDDSRPVLPTVYKLISWLLQRQPNYNEAIQEENLMIAGHHKNPKLIFNKDLSLTGSVIILVLLTINR
jgi:hypothetical protein